ncbi:hypothetical protein T03_730, partial [Trichinella britovi]
LSIRTRTHRFPYEVFSSGPRMSMPTRCKGYLTTM